MDASTVLNASEAAAVDRSNNQSVKHCCGRCKPRRRDDSQSWKSIGGVEGVGKCAMRSEWHTYSCKYDRNYQYTARGV